MWLLLKDPTYPLPIVQCLQSCWEQRYTQRPTAKKLEEIFQKSNCLKLRNSYETANDSVVTAAVVTSHVENEVEEEKIWVATYNKDGSCNLVSYFFTDLDVSSFKMVGQKKSLVHPKLYKTVSCIANVTLHNYTPM